MRQVMAKAKKGGKAAKMKHEVRVRQLDDGKFHVAHHQTPERGPMDNYMPSPEPVESSHDNWKKAAKHIGDNIFGSGSGAGGATADAANAPMPAQTPGAEPDGDEAQ